MRNSPRMQPSDGVIQFKLQHEAKPLCPHRHLAVGTQLIAWRRWLWQLGGIGQSPHRYDGVGFGNASARTGPPSAPQGHRAFLITGTQTGQLAELQLAHCALVTRCTPRLNLIESEGLTPPSSESLTHGAIYDLSAAIRWVFHAHIPHLWQAASQLRIPSTDPSIGYGTPEMAFEMRRLWQSSPLSETRLLAMGGHEDGIIAFGASPEQAALSLTNAWVKAVAHGFAPTP